MSHSTDLLEQAVALRDLDPRRPKQANLRRAISSAYYAVFHQLIEDAVALLLPARLAELRVQVGRKFVHSTMKKVAQAAAKLPNKNLATVGSSFIALQDARHEADYDFSRSFTKWEATEYIEKAREAMKHWEAARTTAEGEQCMVELLLNRLDPA